MIISLNLYNKYFKSITLFITYNLFPFYFHTIFLFLSLFNIYFLFIYYLLLLFLFYYLFIWFVYTYLINIYTPISPFMNNNIS